MRTLDFLVDIPHARRVNEMLADLRRVQVSAGIFAAVFVGAAIGLFVVGETWAIVLAVVLLLAAAGCVYAGIMAPRRAADLHSMYSEHELVPAVVAAVRPRGVTLLALVNLTRDRSQPATWALVASRVQNLPGHRRKVGERVPCVAVTSASKQSALWQQVRPVPIAWGARDEDVLSRAIRAIRHVEWDLLSKSIKRTEEAEQSRQYPILKPKELPPELR
ncbi:DUF3239 domain-containing protein [Hoyosella rhizosphaerae]|uniref:DUF3239 domain-containing protein n=1 Tax=Hoyosella rhizosphaerae TaxID=1755582 RepID=A0A916XIM5_9ACTN|nr:DUF3239 domain-containing protein [Hoyosella rhizosphaerae]MBN4928209.1 DUF3239 domain-containing protein [Hoyosella rhizosphaerae]GGC73236.1 hypothetical protein GCM10011410_27950 [Hoyosella rhizosphaerae]